MPNLLSQLVSIATINDISAVNYLPAIYLLKRNIYTVSFINHMMYATFFEFASMHSNIQWHICGQLPSGIQIELKGRTLPLPLDVVQIY